MTKIEWLLNHGYKQSYMYHTTYEKEASDSNFITMCMDFGGEAPCTLFLSFTHSIYGCEIKEYYRAEKYFKELKADYEQMIKECE